MNFTAWRDRLVILIVALLPWQARYIRLPGTLGGAPWEQGTIGLFALEIAILAALTCHILAQQKNGLPPVASAKGGPVFMKFWALLVLYGACSVAWAPDAYAALFTWFHLFEGFGLAYLIWLSRLPLATLATAFLWGTSISAAVGLFQFFTQTTFASTWLGIAAHEAPLPGVSVVENAGGRFLRAYGLLPHPNIFGGFTAAALVSAMALYVSGVMSVTKRILVAVMAILAVGLVVSFSRSSWIATAAVLAAVGLVSHGRRGIEEGIRWRKVVSYVGALAVLSIVLVWPAASTRLSGQGRLETKSVSERMTSVIQGVELFRLHPATGVGLGNMIPSAYDELSPHLPTYSYGPAHFLPVLAAAELGFFGLMLLVGMAVFWFWPAWRSARRTGSVFAAAMTLLPLVILVAGAFDHYPTSLFAGSMLTGLCFGFSLKASDRG